MQCRHFTAICSKLCDPKSRRFPLYDKVCTLALARYLLQRSVTLSSTEAEWIALSEAAKEIIFVLQLLESLGIKVNLPITVHVDNTGAMFTPKNINTTSDTKHVDVHTKYINQYCEDDVVKIVFVESANNDADIFLVSRSSRQTLKQAYLQEIPSFLRHKFNIGRIWVKSPHIREGAL